LAKFGFEDQKLEKLMKIINEMPFGVVQKIEE
jgi:hypothetical protein